MIRAEAAAEPKCCRKCAFRPGSPERSDPYAWMHLREGWDEGLSFVCHESVPGHRQEIADDRPRMRICAGWQACSTGGSFPRATPGPEFASARSDLAGDAPTVEGERG